MFKNFNISGEWFEPSEDILNYIKDTNDSYQVNRIHQLEEEFINIKNGTTLARNPFYLPGSALLSGSK